MRSRFFLSSASQVHYEALLRYLNRVVSLPRRKRLNFLMPQEQRLLLGMSFASRSWRTFFLMIGCQSRIRNRRLDERLCRRRRWRRIGHRTARRLAVVQVQQANSITLGG